jgi:hypothetical protein
MRRHRVARAGVHSKEKGIRIPTSVEPGSSFIVTATLIVSNIAGPTAFYRDVHGAVDLSEGSRPGKAAGH